MQKTTYQIVQEVQNDFSLRKGCGHQNESRTAELTYTKLTLHFKTTMVNSHFIKPIKDICKHLCLYM